VVCCEDDSSERNAANIVINGLAQISVVTSKQRRHEFFFSKYGDYMLGLSTCQEKCQKVKDFSDGIMDSSIS
jgi:hypothetical protein